MTTYDVFIDSADKWNENTPMNTVHQGERSSEHMLLQKEPSSLMSMTFDSESISRFRTRLSQSQLPWIRRLARIDCLAKPQTVSTDTSPKEGCNVRQTDFGKPAVVPLLQVVFDPGIALKIHQAARQSSYGFVRYLARTCIPPEMSDGPLSLTVSSRDSTTNHGPTMCPSPPPAAELSSASSPVPFPDVMDQSFVPTFDSNPMYSYVYPDASWRTDNAYPIIQDTGLCMWSWNGYPEQTFNDYGGFKGFDTPVVECF